MAEEMELQSKLQFLEKKVKELESQNAKLSSLLLNCKCHKMEQHDDCNSVKRIGLVDGTEKITSGSGDKLKKKNSKHGSTIQAAYQFPRRYVALKVMYFGQRFYGFGSEAHTDPTVESEIFKALAETRLVYGEKKGWQYSRCGRTDKGVSSVGQVIALYLRSCHKVKDGNSGYSGELITDDLCEGELDYVQILNKVLPKDIRVMGWCPVPIDFSARFSCLSREYKYFFWKANLNIVAMEAASTKLVGEHDFRNFCKMDAANVHNFRRRITLFEICPYGERFEGDELWSIRIKGSAFLWHQVRCMVAVLFMIGEGLESPDVVDVLLDVDKISRKPQYNMASEVPLVLQSCEFEGLKFKCTQDSRKALQLHFEKECQSYKLRAAIYQEAMRSSLHLEIDDSSSGATVKKKMAMHVSLMSRPTEPSYEERRLSKLKKEQSKVDETVRKELIGETK